MAYCLDQAVGHFGRSVEAELERAGADCKTEAEATRQRQMALERFISEESDKPRRGQFADPAAMFK